MSINVQWITDPDKYSNSRTLRRREEIDPHARDGLKDVHLAWLKKHAVHVSYRVRWWVGPNGHRGEWHEHVFTDPKTDPDHEPVLRRGVTHLTRAVQLKDLRDYAANIAATVTEWEVEVTMLARTHGSRGWEYNVVWHIGHAKRDTPEARRLRGEEI